MSDRVGGGVGGTVGGGVTVLGDGLRIAIERAGYYPDLVSETVETALGGERVESWLVHHEATFDRDELRRHVTVLVLTPSRLVVGHTDDHPADDASPVPYAITSTEAVPVGRIASVVVSRTLADPATYRRGAAPRDVVLTVGWGVVSRVDLEPAGCGDPECEADHGYTGSVTADDLSVRVSAEGDGADAVQQALVFAAALSSVTSSAGR
jgi:Family of unknown function (DUF5998)